MSLAMHSHLGPYEIQAPLGAGGMGEVYRARDARLERDVAIKVLPAQLAQDAHALARFYREVRAVAALSHPNILAIYDIGTDQGVTFAVMELLQGQTLGDRIKQGVIEWRKAVEIAMAIAEGLAAAHARAFRAISESVADVKGPGHASGRRPWGAAYPPSGRPVAARNCTASRVSGLKRDISSSVNN